MEKNIKLKVLPDEPLISVIIPSLNQGKYIKKTIDSALEQSYPQVEVIVVDGGSADDTLDVLRGYIGVDRVSWFSEPDSGVADAVNKGFTRAKGKILAIQSSDDYYLPGAFLKVVGVFKRECEAGLVYGDIIKINERNKIITKHVIKPFSLYHFLTMEMRISQPAAFFRREILESLKAWDGDYYCCDTEFWLRAIFRTKTIKIDDFLSINVMHPGQRDENYREIVGSYSRMIDSSPDIKKLPFALRQAAQCGKWRLKFRYNLRYNPGRYWKTMYYLWRAVASYPPAFSSLLPKKIQKLLKSKKG